MAVPTISGIVASNDANGGLIATVTFSVAVTAADLTGVSISSGNIDSVSSNALTLVFVIRNQTPDDTLTMDFATGNTITADVGGESLVEDLDVAVTNSITLAVSAAARTPGAEQDSAAIHTAVAVVARDTKTACKAAC